MSLTLHHASRADRLVDGLAEVLAKPQPDAFATDLVSVPTPGVERWLAQRLSHRLGASPGRSDGVCAGVEFWPLDRLIARAVHGAEGLDAWRPDRAVWPLLAAIDDCRSEPWAGMLWAHLDRGRPDDDTARPEARAESGTGDGRRLATARRLAGLFSRYATYRPMMISRWSAGEDADEDGRPLPAERSWQAELWRRLARRIDQPDPVSMLVEARRQLTEQPDTCGLPERLSVFGPTTLAPDRVSVLVGLAEHRDVHLWLPQPSPDLWGRIAASRRCPGPERPARADDSSAAIVRHPLLAALGRDSRELQLSLAAAGMTEGDATSPTASAEPTRPAGDTLLGWLQTDVTADHRPVDGDGRVLAPSDRSVQVHVSHGPDRQVEVLREVLVGLLADDPTLEPRDVVVMCPDIEAFAPLVAATFGLTGGDKPAEHPGHQLRVRLADRAVRNVNPLLALVEATLSLARSRMEASAVLDLCAMGPVARRFGFSTEDLERLHELTLHAGVRWGLDGTHRRRFDMEAFGQNTWSAGLDRMLLGVAMDEAEQRYIGTALPLDDVDSGDADLIGRLAECLSRVRLITDECRRDQPLAEWLRAFRRLWELLAAVGPSDSWQLAHAQHELARLADSAGGGAPTDSMLSPTEMSALLADAFRGRAGRANFRTGTLTVCSLQPMRSVPHRVVCLLGLDDGVFPRRRTLDGDDISADQDRVGDPDPRSEDRQLLLDAVLSATETLVIIYGGRDPRTGAEIPPSVPVGEVLDALEATAQTQSGAGVRSAITVAHPLQPFAPQNFSRDGVPPGPFSFDPAALRAARAPRGSAGPPVAGGLRLAPLERSAVGLADLVRFLRHPPRALLAERAQLWLTAPEERPDEQIPVAVEALERWSIGDRLLRRRLRGQPMDQLLAAEWRRGQVPPRQLGARTLAELQGEVEAVVTVAERYRVGPTRPVPVSVDADGVRLTGTVVDVVGDTAVHVAFARLGASHRLRGWVEVLALTLQEPDRRWQVVTVGRGGSVVVGPVDRSWAERILPDLLELRRSGLAEPLPFAPKTSLEFAEGRWQRRPFDGPRRKRLARTWERERDAAYEVFFGRGADVEVLLAEPSRPDEERGELTHETRFGTLARRVCEPMLRCEQAS